MNRKNTILSLFLAVSYVVMFPVSGVSQETQGEKERKLPSYIDPQEIRRGVPMGGVEGKSRSQLYYERVIKRFEPSLQGDPSRISQYLEAFKSTLLVDSRLFPFGVEGEVTKNGEIVLTGYVGFEENRRSLLNFLKYLGFESINDQIEVLPSDSLGKRVFAFVTSSYCVSYDRAEAPHEPMTQALMGDPIYLLKEGAENSFLCLTAEGYVGYIPGEDLKRVTAREFESYQSGAQVMTQADFRQDDLFIPAGARFKCLKKGQDSVLVELPDGKRAELPIGAVEVYSGEPDARIEKAIEIASRLLGTRYVWGGKTAEGIDCSGLVQTSFKSVGINLARDAYQQAYGGSLVATRWYPEGLRRGDTLFFLGRSGRISHTAIYLGQGKYIEASGRDVHITSFNPDDPEYDARKARSFCFAKRILE